MESRLKVRYLPPQELVPYVRNPRKHPDEQIAKIMASIREFGFTQPILVDGQNGVIAGEGRLLAALRMGSELVPAIELSHLTETQKRAYVIADNKLAELSSWDDELLTVEMQALAEAAFDMSATGFEAAEIAELFAGGGGQTDPDLVLQPPAQPVPRLGDIWVLGQHRLICGDSTSAGTVAQLLAGEQPHLMVTDPPYGVKYDPAWRKAVKNAGQLAVGKVANDDRADWRAAWALFPGDVAYIWHAAIQASIVEAGLQECGFVLRSQIIWRKQRFVIGRGDYHWQHEACWYAVRKGKNGHWNGSRRETTVWNVSDPLLDIDAPGDLQSTVWEISNAGLGGTLDDQRTAHGTQKPVECMRRPIVNNSRGGDAVYEPFSGSGSTIIAAEMEGRRCFAVELDPAYVDIAVRRWQAFTGKAATLAGTEHSFEDVARERLREKEPDARPQAEADAPPHRRRKSRTTTDKKA